MSSIKDIKDIYSNLQKKETETHDRNLGVLDFNSRVLTELLDDRNDVEPLKKLDFLEIFFNNIIEFIQIRYSRINNAKEKEKIHYEIEETLSKSEFYLQKYIEKYLPKYPLTNNELDSDSIPEYKIIDSSTEKSNPNILYVDDYIPDYEIINAFTCKLNPNMLYALFGDKQCVMLVQFPSLSIINIKNGKMFSIISSIKTMLQKFNLKWAYPFRIIPNQNFPYYSIGYESSPEMLEDLEEVLYQKESLKIYGVLVSNRIQLEDSEESYLEKFKEIFHKDLEIFETKTNLPIFGGKDLQNIYREILKNNMDEVNMYQVNRPKIDIMINLNKVNLYPGILFETPFISYNTVIELIHRECYNSHNTEYESKWPNAKVPKTTAVFISLYRVQKNSDIIEDLIHAAKHDIKVFVYVEPLARGNEKENIQLIKRLKRAKVHVISDYYGMKVHAKTFLSLRSDGTMIAHISTGNYDIRRAATFTDYQFITQDTAICEEILEFFKMLIQKQPIITKLDYFGVKERFIKMAPIAMRDTFIDECINQTSDHIYIKCNNLCDTLIIKKLYEASNKGIDVKAICRTSCSLIPKNEYIHIRSNTGKYLEHGRFYCFDDRVYIGSADLLLRNLNKRIELMVRIPDGVWIMAKHGADIIQHAIRVNDPSLAKDQYTLESPNEYFIRCFKDAKWIKKKEDFRFKSILDKK